MWEALATSQAQDRVLHGAAKAFGVLLGTIAAPLWLVGQRIDDPLRRMLAARGAPAKLPLPAPGERSMSALMEELEAIPTNFRSSRWSEMRKGLPDLISFVLAQSRQGLDIGYSYPAQFEDGWYEGADGERIGLSVGVHDVPRPGLIVVHGLFSSRRFEYVRSIAVRAFYEWGFNVAAIDLRSFGATEYLSRAPTTAGWKEGEDVLAAAELLKRSGSTSVGALGISLGGSSVLAGAHLEGAERLLDGGVLALSPPADTEYMVERMSTRTASRRRFDPNSGLRAMLRSRVHVSRWPEDFRDFSDPIRYVSAPYYGVTVEEIWERSSAINTIAGARVPVLAIHSADDWLIPADQSRRLRRAAEGNDLVRVWVVPYGRHGAIDAVDPKWAFTIYRRFFERWAGYSEADHG